MCCHVLTHDDLQVKRMHISMSIKNTIGVYKEVKDYYMVLLDEVMSICAENTADSLIAKAIRQALPGGRLCRVCLQSVCACVLMAGCLASRI